MLACSCNVASCIADWSRGEERNTIAAYGASLLLNFLDMVLSAALIKREPNRQRTHHFSMRKSIVDSLSLRSQADFCPRSPRVFSWNTIGTSSLPGHRLRSPISHPNEPDFRRAVWGQSGPTSCEKDRLIVHIPHITHENEITDYIISNFSLNTP